MRIGVLGAMPEEVALLEADIIAARSHAIGGRRYHEGELYGQSVVLAFSRMGKVASASTATTMIAEYGVDLIVFSGVAGAAAADLTIGDVVVADAMAQHDMDARPLFSRFEVPLLGCSRFAAEPKFAGSLLKAAGDFLSEEGNSRFNLEKPKARLGLIGSGDQFMSDPAKLTALREALPGLACVEMEGAAVAQVCHEHGIPLAVARVISDKADHSAAVDFSHFVKTTARYYSQGILKRFFAALKDG